MTKPLKPQVPTNPRRKAPAAKPLPMERVHLLRAHTHQGKLRPAGDEIAVHPDTAQWLRAQGVVALA